MIGDKPSIGVIAFFGCLIAVTIFIGVVVVTYIGGGGFDPWILPMALYAWMIGIFIAMVTAMPIGCLIGWLFSRFGSLNWLTSAVTGMLTAIILAGAVTFGDWTVATMLGLSAFALLGFVSGMAAYWLTEGRRLVCPGS
jgi:hypothetical protein